MCRILFEASENNAPTVYIGKNEIKPFLLGKMGISEEHDFVPGKPVRVTYYTGSYSSNIG
jgi:hypothetical protein